MTIRLVLADDHPLVLRGLEHLFAAEADCETFLEHDDPFRVRKRGVDRGRRPWPEAGNP